MASMPQPCRHAAAALCALCALLLAAQAPAAETHSGFLSDYSKLKEESDGRGGRRKVWVNPAMKQKPRGTYASVMLAPFVFVPAPQATSQVPVSALEEIRGYMDATLRKALGAEVPLAETPGPDVVGVRGAITGVAVSKGLKPWELVPVGMVIAGAKEAAGVRKHEVRLFVEVEFNDGVTNETIALGMREIKGIKVAANAQLTLADARSQIDAWGGTLREAITEFLRERAAGIR